MKIESYERRGHWLRETLRAVISLYVCLHDDPIKRRGPDGAMGLECADCGRWFPLAGELRERSKLATRLALQEKKSKAMRHARPGSKDPLVCGPREVRMLPSKRHSLPTGKEIAHA